MVDNKKDLLAYLVTEFFYAMVGANIYAKEALLDNKFRQLMISKLENLKSNVTQIIGDESLIENASEHTIQLIFELKRIVERMRDLYERVYLIN